MIWSILIASLARRSESLAQVVEDLGQQLVPGVEVIVYRNHGEKALGEIRQALVEAAGGTYLNFVDDDDRLPGYYVDEVVQRLDGEVDYIGWRMQAYIDGFQLKPTYHTLDVDHWWESDTAYWRDFSHLNPVRADFARLADFRRVDPPEDVSWADQLRIQASQLDAIGLGLTQAVVPDDKVMYHYYSRSADSTWRPGSEPAWNGSGEPFPELPAGCRWHPEST